MPRVRIGAARNRSRKRILRGARGYYGARKSHRYLAKDAIIRGGDDSDLMAAIDILVRDVVDAKGNDGVDVVLSNEDDIAARRVLIRGIEDQGAAALTAAELRAQVNAYLVSIDRDPLF